MPKTVAFHTFGCKLNFSETSTLRRQLESVGYGIVPFEQAADVFVVNTCSVTEFADRKCRKLVQSLKRRAPESRVVLTGCYAQLQPGNVSEIPGVDFVIGANEKFRLAELLDRRPDGTHVCASELSGTMEFHSAWSTGQRTRSFLKVQDGCDYRCSFCTIPDARGQSRSDTIDGVIDNILKLEDEEVQEVVLTGVNTGDFGRGAQGGRVRSESFLGLLNAIERRTSIPRVRISSIEPNLLHKEIVSFVAESPRFMPHFHVPLQSGSDRILNAMRRRYQTAQYAETMSDIRAKLPEAGIGIDVITGFPGETEEDFERTFQFLHGLDFSYLHVFTYSCRPGTPAEKLEGHVPLKVRQERNARLRNLSSKKKHEFYHRQLGQTRDVLFESDVQAGWREGYTDNYLRVAMPEAQVRENDVVAVSLQTLTSPGLIRGHLPNKN